MSDAKRWGDLADQILRNPLFASVIQEWQRDLIEEFRTCAPEKLAQVQAEFQFVEKLMGRLETRIQRAIDEDR